MVPDSSLNDLRVDVRDGRALAYVTDQGQAGAGAILAVDLDTGRWCGAWRTMRARGRRRAWSSSWSGAP